MTSFLKPPIELRRGYKSKSRLDLIGKYADTYGCMACNLKGLTQTYKTDIHHLAGIGAGLKASDNLCFPLCQMHHNHDGGVAGFTIHKGIAEFEDLYLPQKEFINLLNEKIFEDNNLKGKDLRAYELIKEFCNGKEEK